MVQFLRILSALHLFSAIACFFMLRENTVMLYTCSLISLALFFTNARRLGKYTEENNALISNLIFNTISLAIIIWLYV